MRTADATTLAAVKKVTAAKSCYSIGKLRFAMAPD